MYWLNRQKRLNWMRQNEDAERNIKKWTEIQWKTFATASKVSYGRRQLSSGLVVISIHSKRLWRWRNIINWILYTNNPFVCCTKTFHRCQWIWFHKCTTWSNGLTSFVVATDENVIAEIIFYDNIFLSMFELCFVLLPHCFVDRIDGMFSSEFIWCTWKTVRITKSGISSTYTVISITDFDH